MYFVEKKSTMHFEVTEKMHLIKTHDILERKIK